MRRGALGLCAALLASLALASPAAADFGIRGFDVEFAADEGGEEMAGAGTHPFAVTVSVGANFDKATLTPEGWLRDLITFMPPGFVGDTTAYKRCTTAQFLQEGELEGPNCPVETQVGAVGASLKVGDEAATWEVQPLYNVEPPPGVLVRLGFSIVTQDIFIDATLNTSPPHNAIAGSRNTAQIFEVFGAKIQLWGSPSDEAHDKLRHPCGPEGNAPPPGDIEGFEFLPGASACGVDDNPKPFLTMPTSCQGPLESRYEALSWNDLDKDGLPDTDAGGALTPEELAGCETLSLNPEISPRPTSAAASSPTGLDFELQMKDEGLTSTTGTAASQMRKAVVTLPEGMTINPSQAEGLEVCSEGDLEDETLDAEPGEGCPQASKVGNVEVDSPLISATLKGGLFVAEPFRNLADDSLIAVYLVIKNRDLGIVVKQPLKVNPHPETGQIVTTADDVPQLPFSEFRLHFREGGRSPLVTPPTCGEHEVEAELYPWSGTPKVRRIASFEIVSGPDEGPCPPGGTPPHEPGFAAGSASNAAGAYSPFLMRLTRRDGDQDLTRFDATLPVGVLARIAGVGRCLDAQIALAEAKSGKEEQAASSCPPSSRIGGVLAGAGVGSQLTYVPGNVYLAGPFGGAPLSAVAIVPAVAGPFDVGNVVYRQALVVDPRTGVVTADGSLSDSLPNILAGIPLVVRDVQVSIDRPGFTLNPTSCDPLATVAGIWGGGTDPDSPADDALALRSTPYQAASCQALPYAPRLGLSLKGSTKRGGHPALRTVFRPRPGHANSKRVVVRFPLSAFVEQAHIRTVCTRVQFAADACPKGSIYGRVAAFTPLLDQPLRGPVYLRSSNNTLPDLVFDLKGEVDFEAVARVDSIRGALRAIAYGIPDAPIEKVVIQMQGGKKGLIVNSRNLCQGKNRAKLRFDAHSAKRHRAAPVVRARCGGRTLRRPR